MKKVKMNFMMVLLLSGITLVSFSQSPNEWRILLNNDHAAFQMKIFNKEMTFTFNPQTDTLSFYPGTKKPVKAGIVVEVSLKNNKKVIYTSTDKNLTGDKMGIVVPMADVYNGLKNVKIPAKPKYIIAIMDKTTVKEQITFEFPEK
jgi:hypothetical protein